jgi:hypothetical protein
MTPWDVCS